MQRFHLAILAAVGLAALTCAAPAVSAQDLKAAFIYVGPVGDAGWTFRHDQGRKCLEQQGIPTSFVESVPETPDVANIERDFLSQGASMGVRRVVLNGGFTDCCVLNAAFDASNRNYRVIVVKDLVRGTNEEMEDAALKMISLHLGLVMDSIDLLEGWRAFRS